MVISFAIFLEVHPAHLFSNAFSIFFWWFPRGSVKCSILVSHRKHADVDGVGNVPNTGLATALIPAPDTYP
jgi:hypothetical protein